MGGCTGRVRKGVRMSWEGEGKDSGGGWVGGAAESKVVDGSRNLPAVVPACEVPSIGYRSVRTRTVRARK